MPNEKELPLERIQEIIDGPMPLGDVKKRYEEGVKYIKSLSPELQKLVNACFDHFQADHGPDTLFHYWVMKIYLAEHKIICPYCGLIF